MRELAPCYGKGGMRLVPTVTFRPGSFRGGRICGRGRDTFFRVMCTKGTLS